MGKEVVNDLRERGVRVTLQRTHTWRFLAESKEHLTAEEVWERARAALPGLELSTVYRLEALRAVGLVADSRLPEGPRVFEARSASHPHMVCEAARGGPGDVYPLRRGRGRGGLVYGLRRASVKATYRRR